MGEKKRGQLRPLSLAVVICTERPLRQLVGAQIVVFFMTLLLIKDVNRHKFNGRTRL